MENVGEEKLSYKKKKWQEWKDELIERKNEREQSLKRMKYEVIEWHLRIGKSGKTTMESKNGKGKGRE